MRIRKRSFVFYMTIWLILILATACGTFALPQDENTTDQENISPIVSTQHDTSSTEDMQGDLVEMPSATVTVTLVLKPTFTPTITPTSLLPTVTSIVTEDLVTTDNLAEGLKIVYAETTGKTGETKIWMSNVEQLERRVLLTEVIHKPRYGLGGKVSPDGSKLYYLVIPPDSSSKSISEIGYEVWLLDINTQTSVRIIENMNGFIKWLPNGQEIIYSRETYTNRANGDVSSQIYIMSIDNFQETFVSSISNSIIPVSFSNTNGLLYLNGHELKAIDLISGEDSLLQKIDVSGFWDRYNISPDGRAILISKLNSNLDEKMYELILVSLEDGRKETVLTTPYVKGQSNNPLYRFNVRWMPDSQQALIYVPPLANQPPYLALGNIRQNMLLQPLLDNASFTSKTTETNNLEDALFPSYWSPNATWLLLKHYPNIDTEIYLFEIETNKMTRIPSTDPSHWVRHLGWIRDEE